MIGAVSHPPNRLSVLQIDTPHVDVPSEYTVALYTPLDDTTLVSNLYAVPTVVPPNEITTLLVPPAVFTLAATVPLSICVPPILIVPETSTTNNGLDTPTPTLPPEHTTFPNVPPKAQLIPFAINTFEVSVILNTVAPAVFKD